MNLYEEFKRDLYHGEWAERVAIGHMIASESGAKEAIEEHRLDISDFYFANTRAIFKAIGRLYTRRIPLEIVNIVQSLEDGLSDIGGLYTLKDCIDRAEGTKGTVKRGEVFDLLKAYQQNRQVLFLIDRIGDDEDPFSPAISS